MYEWSVEKITPLDYLLSILSASLPRSKVFFIHGSFGDVYVQCAIVRELVLKNQLVTILVEEKYKLLAEQAFAPTGNPVAEKNKLIVVESKRTNHYLSRLDLLGNFGPLPIRLLPTLYPGIAECISAGLLSQGSFMRLIAGSDCTGKYPKLEQDLGMRKEAEKILTNAGGKQGISVLISADNNTHKELPEKFWSETCEYISSLGWIPLINNSGTGNFGQANILSQSIWPKISVPPHLATTIPSVAGHYIGGSNGFSTIQALFNEVDGLHFINGLAYTGSSFEDKFKNKHTFIKHEDTISGQNLGYQKEIIVQNGVFDDECKNAIKKILV